MPCTQFNIFMPETSTQNPSSRSSNWISAAASVVPAVVSGIGSIFGSHRSKEAQKLSFEQQKQLMEMQNGFNIDMWNRNNDYNSPLHQLRLLQASGLNPNVFGNSYSPASPQSSEVTAASGSSPGPSNDGAILSQGADRISNYLSQLAIQKKLKQEIRGLTIANDEAQAAYDAKKRPLPNIYNGVSNDDQGNPIIETYPDTNYWDEERQGHRIGRKRDNTGLAIDSVNYERLNRELEVYEASMPYLKKMSKWQLNQLKEDVRNKRLNNTLLNDDVNFAKKYGVSPSDDGWKALMKIALTDEGNFNRIIDRLIVTGEKTVTHQFSRLKDFLIHIVD